MREIKFRAWDVINKVMTMPHTYADATHVEKMYETWIRQQTINEVMNMIENMGKERHEWKDENGEDLRPIAYNIFTLGEVLKRLEKLKNNLK